MRRLLGRRGASAEEARRYVKTTTSTESTSSAIRIQCAEPMPLAPRACENRPLTRVTGVKTYDVSLDKQTAHIVTEPSLDYTTVLEKIKKTGKKVNSGEADGVTQAV